MGKDRGSNNVKAISRKAKEICLLLLSCLKCSDSRDLITALIGTTKAHRAFKVAVIH